MGKQYQSGFTIIEVTLFLAVSGLLAVGILAGVGNTINQQRYRDSVNSFMMLLQNQYSNVINTQNDRSRSPEVENSLCSGNTESRGRTNCVIAGRLLYSSNGKDIVTGNVIATTPDEYSLTDSDDTAFRSIGLTIDPSSLATQTIEWEAKLANNSGTGANFSVFIGRSPAGGNIKTFITTTYAPETPSSSNPEPTIIWNNIIKSEALTTNLEVCVISQAPMLGPTRQVQLLAGSSSASSVTTGDEGACS
jgi:type II secretory pathway pseudopilin PulG